MNLLDLTPFNDKQKMYYLLNEITLSDTNAAEINRGGDFNGIFEVNGIKYSYEIYKLPIISALTGTNSYSDGDFYNIEFDDVETFGTNLPTGKAKEGYIKILSTMYKIIKDFTQEYEPKYVGIASIDDSGYWSIYNRLTKTNKIPGYNRVNSGLPFNMDGVKGKMIVLKNKNI